VKLPPDSVLMRAGRLLRDAAVGWWNDDVPRMGASLSYFTLFAIAPVLIIAIAVAGLAFGPDAVRGQVVQQLEGLLGHIGAEAVQSLLQGASHRRASIVATIIGGLTSLIAATGAFMELQSALNNIWRVKPDPGADVTAFVANRARAFGLVLAIGFLLLVSLAVSAGLDALGGWLGAHAIARPAFWHVVNIVISLAVVTLLFAMLFKYLPDVRLRWRDVLTGSAVTAVLFTIGKEVIGLYLGQGSVASTYGAAASVVVLLLWVYYASQILLFGAEVVKFDTCRRLGHAPPPRHAHRIPEPAAK
jgi:membrane protein